MCGICGFFETSNTRLSMNDLVRMTDIMTHRGPDASGYCIGEHGRTLSSEHCEGSVGLGHRRLSILDLSSNANQPMFFNNGNLIVLHNGEIFNYRELQKEYFADRAPLTTSDTEVIGWAYEKWGLDCFSYFEGFFSIAIYDVKKDVLVLARDRMGKKPLFYYYDNGHFIFGSELKALIRHPNFSRKLHVPSLHAYLAFLYVPGEGCILENCRKLGAGCLLTINSKGDIYTNRYFDVLKEAADVREISYSESEYEQELDKLLSHAVRQRLISDVPLGAFLSGGIDSSTVLAYMCKNSSGPVKTFSIAFDDPKYDEAPYAASVAKHLNTEHTEFTAQPSHMIQLIERMPFLYDEPFADPSALPTTLLSELTRKHVTVALSGDGGDELFLGYDRYTRIMNFPNWGWIPHAIRAAIAQVMYLMGHKGIKLGRRLAQPDVCAFFMLKSSVFNVYDFKSLIGSPFTQDEELAGAFHNLKTVPIYRRIRAIEMRNYLCDDILQKVDRASMSCALETRNPLLDHRIVKFALSLPQDMLLRDRKRKYILKNLLFKHVPPKLFDRPKAGFRVPLGEWFRKELKSTLEHYLSPERIKKQGLFRYEYVQQLLETHMSAKGNEPHKLFTLLVFQLWNDEYLN